MTPQKTEVQLGHLCNNRCVFCISGHRTHERRAPILSATKLEEEIRAAKENGQTSITFLGGEPTVQPFFLDLVEFAADLGFDEIVIFSNGSRLHRPAFMDRILATGATFEFRFSFQGATCEAHERTTKRRGSFEKLLAAVALAAKRNQRIAVNMCVVKQNFESVAHFGPLLEPFGVRQLHLDMMHPEDSPGFSPEQLGHILPRYTDLVAPLDRMYAQMPSSIEAQVGNLPFCVAPHLADRIHHGGPSTLTNSASSEGAATLDGQKDKYESKTATKFQPPACRTCVVRTGCSGLFPEYAEIYGTEECRPLSGRAVAKALSLPPPLASLVARILDRGAFGALTFRSIHSSARRHRIELMYEGEGHRVALWIDATRARRQGGYQIDGGEPGKSPPGSVTAAIRSMVAFIAGRADPALQPSPAPAAGAEPRLDTAGP